MSRLSHRILFAALLCSAGAHSQTFRAQLTGVVTDASGAVVLGAEMTATNLDTGVSQSASSNE